MQNVYMGNKFLTLRKSEVAKVAPDRAGIPGFSVDWKIGEQREEVLQGELGYRKQWTARTYIKRAEMALNDR